jgi:hypothetical protein
LSIVEEANSDVAEVVTLAAGEALALVLVDLVSFLAGSFFAGLDFFLLESAFFPGIGVKPLSIDWKTKPILANCALALMSEPLTSVFVMLFK